MLKNYLFTSESVSEGHPDKVCDQISDRILDLFLAKNPEARVACETAATTNHVTLLGEVRANIDKEEIDHAVRDVVKTIGYEQDGFHWKNLKINNLLHEQSADIAVGVDSTDTKEEGAGDQGIMFGYACRESEALMPAPIAYAHGILRSLAEARHSDSSLGLEPDAKSQVTLKYENGTPVGVESVVLSTQHREDLHNDDLAKIVISHIQKILPQGWMPAEDKLFINPTGRFVIGGPDGDAGLTGRKIIVDTYGGSAPHGGGAFSGKDPTKVDRSAAYAARYLAKNVVASGIADICTIQLSYAIGVARPLSVYVNTHGTGKVDELKIANVLQELVDLSPRGIRTHLSLNKAIYYPTASYGHFGRTATADGFFSWEKTDLVDQLKSACK